MWDLDDGRAPHVRGELHALLLDNDVFGDDIYFKHYQGAAYVAQGATGNGRPDNPYGTVAEAYRTIANLGWFGARLEIGAGRYDEGLTITMPVRISAWDGPAVVGQAGRVKLAPSGAIGLRFGAALRSH